MEKTAKKASWTLEGTNLCVKYPDGNTTTFNMIGLYPMFPDFTLTQKNTACYGVKQKLSDSCARPATEKLTNSEAITQMVTTWKALLDGSAWTKKVGEKTPSVSKSKVETELQNMYDNATTDDMKLAVLGMAEKLGVTVVEDDEGNL